MHAYTHYVTHSHTTHYMGENPYMHTHTSMPNVTVTVTHTHTHNSGPSGVSNGASNRGALSNFFTRVRYPSVSESRVPPPPPGPPKGECHRRPVLHGPPPLIIITHPKKKKKKKKHVHWQVVGTPSPVSGLVDELAPFFFAFQPILLSCSSLAHSHIYSFHFHVFFTKVMKGGLSFPSCDCVPYSGIGIHLHPFQRLGSTLPPARISPWWRVPMRP